MSYQKDLLMNKYRISEMSPRYYAGELVRMQMVCLPDDDPLVPTEDGRWWGVFDDANKELVGSGAMRDTKNWSQASYLCRAGILKKARGNGLQGRLIKVRENASRKAGKKFMVVDCTLRNIPSANNLIKAGYLMYEPNHKWGLPDSIYWMKTL